LSGACIAFSIGRQIGSANENSHQIKISGGTAVLKLAFPGYLGSAPLMGNAFGRERRIVQLTLIEGLCIAMSNNYKNVFIFHK